MSTARCFAEERIWCLHNQALRQNSRIFTLLCCYIISVHHSFSSHYIAYVHQYGIFLCYVSVLLSCSFSFTFGVMLINLSRLRATFLLFLRKLIADNERNCEEYMIHGRKIIIPKHVFLCLDSMWFNPVCKWHSICSTVSLTFKTLLEIGGDTITDE